MRSLNNIADELERETDPGRLHQLTEELFQAMVDAEKERIGGRIHTGEAAA